MDILLKAMEDNRDQFVVIVAGYTELMKQFVNSNPGLASRFSKYMYFEDYTAEQLIEILKSMSKKQQYEFSEEALEYSKRYFENRIAAQSENFANAREVRNYMEKAIENHAGRVVNMKDVNQEVLCRIEHEDVEK